MSLKNTLRAPLLAAALCLSILLPQGAAFAQAASAPDAPESRDLVVALIEPSAPGALPAAPATAHSRA